MKKVGYIFLILAMLLIFYSIFLKVFPLKKDVFYTNDERLEEYTYTKNYFPVVIAGSSLSGIFESKKLFGDTACFNLYFPFSGACTSVEAIRRTNKIPKILLVEINHIDRGIDTVLIKSVFNEPFFSLKNHLPFLLKKNQLLHNIIDRIKAPHNNIINSQQPPAILYNVLLKDAQNEWNKTPDTVKFNRQFNKLKNSLDYLSKKGCRVYFYELPMDNSLNKSPLLTYERGRFSKLSNNKNYNFIKADTSRSYMTGDGVHLLSAEGDIYIKYLLKQLKN